MIDVDPAHTPGDSYLEIPSEKIKAFFEEEPKLKIYRQYVDDIQRRKAHTLNKDQEKLVAEYTQELNQEKKTKGLTNTLKKNVNNVSLACNAEENSIVPINIDRKPAIFATEKLNKFLAILNINTQERESINACTIPTGI